MSVLDNEEIMSVDEEADALMGNRDAIEPADFMGLLGGPGVVGKALLGASLAMQSGNAEAGIADAAYKLQRLGMVDKAKELLQLGVQKSKAVKEGDMFHKAGTPEAAASSIKRWGPEGKIEKTDELMNAAVRHIVTQNMRARKAQEMQQMPLFAEDLTPLLASLMRRK